MELNGDFKVLILWGLLIDRPFLKSISQSPSLLPLFGVSRDCQRLKKYLVLRIELATYPDV